MKPREVRPTDLQLSILSRVAGGHTTAEISRDLGYASSTVRNTLSELYEHYGARSQAHAVALALRRGDILFPVDPRSRRDRKAARKDFEDYVY